MSRRNIEQFSLHLFFPRVTASKSLISNQNSRIMKGIVFTEFLEMVEEKFGYEVTEKMIANADLPSKGAYTSVGTYDHSEMYSLIGELHKSTEIPVPQLMHVYGLHLFGALATAYAPMLSGITSAFDMLKSVDQYIHVEVRKLYPDAELPHFEIQELSEDKMVMIYSSERRMSDVASGLIEGCLKHYKESATVTKEMIIADGSKVKFEIVKN